MIGSFLTSYSLSRFWYDSWSSWCHCTCCEWADSEDLLWSICFRSFSSDDELCICNENWYSCQHNWELVSSFYKVANRSSSHTLPIASCSDLQLLWLFDMTTCPVEVQRESEMHLARIFQMFSQFFNDSILMHNQCERITQSQGEQFFKRH